MSLGVPVLKASMAITFDSAMYGFVSAVAGDLLILGVVHEHRPNGIQSVTWNGLEWTPITQAPLGNSKGALWYLVVPEDADTIAAINFSGSVRLATGMIYGVTGAAVNPSDMDSAGFGSGLAIDSGVTPTTSQANELVIGMALTEGATDLEGDDPGTWLHSMTALDRNIAAAAGLQLSIDMAYRLVSAAGQYRAAQTLTTRARPWAALCATLRESVPLIQKPPPFSVSVENPRESLPVENDRVSASAEHARESVAVPQEPSGA